MDQFIFTAKSLNFSLLSRILTQSPFACQNIPFKQLSHTSATRSSPKMHLPRSRIAFVGLHMESWRQWTRKMSQARWEIVWWRDGASNNRKSCNHGSQVTETPSLQSCNKRNGSNRVKIDEVMPPTVSEPNRFKKFNAIFGGRAVERAGRALPFPISHFFEPLGFTGWVNRFIWGSRNLETQRTLTFFNPQWTQTNRTSLHRKQVQKQIVQVLTDRLSCFSGFSYEMFADE